MRKIHLLIVLLAGLLTSCENGDWEFPDFDYQTVYFSYQSPVRTITLGEDIFDTSLDNNYQCMIMATTGGAYNNTSEIVIDYRVDNTLCDNLFYDRSGNTETPVLAMPADYYSLSANQMVIEKGQESGGIVVQLTDAFFADPLALRANYVIPVVMEGAQNVDSVLAGKPAT
ncbi:MAG: DUF1735 domain-containing protein, partial [Bacteroidales bacterium]|nr:DUF1735 domain-containing protein [Bacteroidales bacterium]